MRRDGRPATCQAAGESAHTTASCRLRGGLATSRKIPAQHTAWPGVCTQQLSEGASSVIKIRPFVAQAVMGIMHGDVWGEKQKVIVAGPDSKLLWHLSFGANMNPKACRPSLSPWPSIPDRIHRRCPPGSLHLHAANEIATAETETLVPRRAGAGDGAEGEAGAEQAVHRLQLHARVHSQVQQRQA